MRQTALTIELDNVVCLEAAEIVQQSAVPVFILFSIGNLLFTEIQAFMLLEDECLGLDTSAVRELVSRVSYLKHWS